MPLLDTEEAWRRYAAWEEAEAAADGGGGDGAAAQQQQQRDAEQKRDGALRELQKRRPLEVKLAAAVRAGARTDPWARDDGGASPLWDQYVALEETADPWRARCVHERLLAPPRAADGGGGTEPLLCAQPANWLRYLRFLRDGLKAPPLVAAASARAVRNCAGSAALWAERLRALEASGASPDEMQSEFERALSAQLAADDDDDDEAAAAAAAAGGGGGGSPLGGYLRLLHVYSQYQRRRAAALDAGDADGRAAVRAARDAVLSYQAAYLPGAEADYALPRFWAAAEAHTLGDIEQARALLEPVVREIGGANAEIWLELAALERECGGGVDRARGVFRRAAGVVGSHAPHEAAALRRAWLSFEGTHGTLSQLQAAEARCATIAVAQRERREAAAERDGAAAAAERDERPARQRPSGGERRKQAREARRARRRRRRRRRRAPRRTARRSARRTARRQRRKRRRRAARSERRRRRRRARPHPSGRAPPRRSCLAR